MSLPCLNQCKIILRKYNFRLGLAGFFVLNNNFYLITRVAGDYPAHHLGKGIMAEGIDIVKAVLRLDTRESLQVANVLHLFAHDDIPVAGQGDTQVLVYL